ncbi:MAG TPA: SDR family oxidoreductase [Burkholderiales bacterium]|nr:SDR family oxidoreductase [Burkholderiales bacterium]
MAQPERIMSRSGSGRRVALVTGAGKRIGRAISLALADDGWDLALHFNRSQAEASQVAALVQAKGRRAITLDCDLADAAQTSALIERCKEALGAPTCLVNSAALFEYDAIGELDPANWQRHMDVNLRAPMLLARDFAKYLPENTTGCIVNLLDQKVFNLNPDFFSYTVAKIALEGATRVLALALAPRVRVCGVAPGITLVSGEQTEEGFARAHRMAPLGRSSNLEDVAEAVRFVANAKAMTGTTIVVDGGQHLWPARRDVQFESGKSQ